MADKKVTVRVGYSVDKAGLEEMQSYFQRIANNAANTGGSLNTELKKAGQTAKTLDGILEKTFNENLGTLNVTKFNQEMQKSGLTMKSVKADLTAIGDQGAYAYNKLSQAILGTNMQLKQTSKTLDQMFITFKNTIRYGISSSIFNNFTNSIQKAYSYARDLDESLNNIRIVTGKSADEMDRFAVKANEAAKRLSANTLDYSNAALIYYQQGLSDLEAQARAETTVKVANVTGQAGKEVSEQLTAVWNGYKVSAQETETYVDKLAAVAATTAADLQELSIGMSKVASAANAMGVDFDDLNAQIATIVSVTRQAPESVGTALKTIYARLGDLKVDGIDEFGVKLGEVTSQMQTMGIEILDQNGNMRDMTSVMAEVAEKWNTWTSAQRQAAAVAMAGKRQYNNLIALFDNWDMYTNALNTSIDALGTLQKQQDIYAESTNAKIKKLKATWQDFYAGIIDKDELDAGIDALNNLVQVFDNFVDSFGGGGKSLLAFGSILANVFNKQIIDSINGAIQRAEVFKQNLALTRANLETRQAGIAEVGPNASPEQLANVENLKVQHEYAEKIYEARIGLNEEQFNTLVNYQKELGYLAEEATYIEEKVKNEQLSILSSEEINDLLHENDVAASNIVQTYDEAFDIAENELKVHKELTEKIQEQTAKYNDAEEIQISLLTLQDELNNKEREKVDIIFQEIKGEKNVAVIKQKINNILKGQNELLKNNVKEQTKVTNAVQETIKVRERLVDIDRERTRITKEVNDMLETAKNFKKIGQNITVITSALGNMAMAWNSVNSLMQTWDDDASSFGDKLTQTFMTMGFTLPMMISSFKKLGTTFGVTTGLFDALAARKEKQLILDKAMTVLGKERTKQEVEAIVLKHKDAIMSQKLADANARLSTSMLGAASSATLLVGALTGLALIIAEVVVIYKKYQEERLKEAQASLDIYNEKQKEIQANNELYNSYQKAYEQYQQGVITKEDLVKSTEALAEKYHIEGLEVAKLTGKYEALNEEIKKAREEEFKQNIKDSIEAEKGAAEKVRQAARKGNGRIIYGAGADAYNGYEVSFGNPIDSMSFATALKGNSSFYNYGALQVDNIDDPKKMLQLYTDVKKTVDQLAGTAGANEEGYKNAVKWLDQMKESIAELQSVYDARKTSQSDMMFLAYDIDSVKTLEEYEDKISELRRQLKLIYNDETEVEKIITNHFKDTSNNFIKTGRQLETVKTIFTNWDDTQWEHFREEIGDKNLIKTLLSGTIDLVDLINFNPDQVIEILKPIQDIVNQQDLNVVVSLRTKITSNKKLSKKEIEEQLSEESTLLKDNAVLFQDFDNKSSLEQLDTLNNLLVERIKLNKEIIQQRKETYSNIITEAEEEIARIKAQTGVHSAQEELEYRKKIAEQEAIIAKYRELSSQEKFDDEYFNSLIAGIDGVIDKNKMLRDSIDAVGEGWTIAADKIEDFAKKFPMVFDAQENYQFLEDGTLQLTEQGQEQLKQQIELQKEQLTLQHKAYIQELEQQADIKLAQSQYYKDTANAIYEALDNQDKAAELESTLKTRLEEYKVRLIKATGATDEEINKIIQQNSINTSNIEIKNVEDMAKAWEELGYVMAAVKEAERTGEFKPPTWGGSRAEAPAVTVSSTNKIDDIWKSNIGDFKTLTEEEKQALKALADDLDIEADKLYNEWSTINSKIMAEKASYNLSMSKLDSMGKGKNSKSQKDKELKNEFDRYYDIKNAITLVGNALERVEKIQSKLHGKELIQSLQNENKLIKQQADNYEILYEQQKQEANELQSSLIGYGVNFDNNGYITNYAAITQSMLDQYQAAVAGGLSDEAKQTYEKAYEEFKDDLERYNTLFYSEMKDTRDKLDDALRQQIENNLKIWETEIQIKLDVEEAKRNWADFLKEMGDDFRKVYKDLSIDMNHFMLKIDTYTGLGTIETDLQAIRDVVIEIDKMNSGHSSSMFESISEAQEKLKELDSQLESDAKNMKDLWQDAWKTYLDGIDQTKDQLGDIEDRFEKINEELDFQSKIIELLYGDEAYSMLNTLYKGQEMMSENQITSVKTQVDLWHQLWTESGATMENQSDWTEDQKKYYEEWMEAQNELNELVTDYIDLLKNDYLNTVNDVLKRLESALTGSSLSDISIQWERITKDTTKYYDSIEQVYEAQKFANKIDKEISKTSNIKNQQRLMELRDREVNYLREKQNLTKYDLDAAEARYQIALKEIALEEAQQNKTSMKLVRNEQGNWSYQYMADADDVQDKQDDLLQSYGDLYKLAGDAYQDNLSALQSLQSEYLDSAREIYENMYLSEEEKEIKLEQLRTYYYDQYNKLAEENQLYRNDLTVSGSALLLQVYKQDEEAYSYMTESERSMLDTLINSSIESYQDLQDKAVANYNNIGAASIELMEEVRNDWTATAQLLADSWNADDGASVKSQVLEAHNSITQATIDYKEKVDWCAEEVNRNFGEDGISGSINKASAATYILKDATETLVNESSMMLLNLKTVIEKIGDAWFSVNGKVVNAINTVQDYLSIVGQVKEVTAQLYDITSGKIDLQAIIDALGGGGNGKTPSSDDELYVVHDGVGSTYYARGLQEAEKIAKQLDEQFNRPGQAHIMKASSFGSFDTGGYTGDWNNDNGKLAILHQKELVLNQNDTSNFLKGISMLRDMTALNGSIEQSIAASIGAMVLQLNGMNIGNISPSSSSPVPVGGDTYYVTAEFPNANSVEEIKQAILNLPNVVSQYTNKTSY